MRKLELRQQLQTLNIHLKKQMALAKTYDLNDPVLAKKRTQVHESIGLEDS